MSRKDYILIAEALNITFPDQGQWDERTAQAFTDLVERLSLIFKADNPSFDRDRFLAAVGVK